MARYRIEAIAWGLTVLLAAAGCSGGDGGGGDDPGGRADATEAREDAGSSPDTDPSPADAGDGDEGDARTGAEDVQPPPDGSMDAGDEDGGPSGDATPADGDVSPIDARTDGSPTTDGGLDGTADTPGDTLPTYDGSAPFLCETCSKDSECGGPSDRCIELADNQKYCTQVCDPDASSPCPDAYTCTLFSENASTGQCVPDRLTCVDRCTNTNCGSGEVCNPITGSCVERRSQCESCQIDRLCGDGPDDRCITLPDTNGESICATSCNPQSGQTECPLNNFCTPLDPNAQNPTRGLCIPIGGTCRDRCANKDCPQGENCNRKTGQCEKAQYGACQKGCTSSAQCGDQEDRCFALGFVQDPHCWQDCSDPGDSCPTNYECQQLPNTTVSLCIPSAQRCQQCYGTNCFSQGKACDPQSGQCVERSQSCTQTGCSDPGTLCDPRSGNCVEVGRTCSGDSWAQDCDYTVTGCTTQIQGTEGTCREICTSSGQCGSGRTCVSTNLNRGYCLDDARGGPKTCGTLHPANREVGAPCESDGDCGGGAPTCVQSGNIRGFCSKSCSTDADCAGRQRCGRTTNGSTVCLPPQCACASSPGVASGVESGLETALSEIDLDQCDLYVEPKRSSQIDAVDVPLADSSLVDDLRLPMSTMSDREQTLSGLDGASTPASALVEGAAAADMSIKASSKTYDFSGSNSPLTQAIADLVRAAGGSPNTSQIEQQTSSVPTSFQEKVAAPLVAAVADAYEARQQAFSNATGWGNPSNRQTAFEVSPYLFLPGTQQQLNQAPDLTTSSVRDRYRRFPLQEMADASADLAATIETVRQNAANANSSNWSGFSFTYQTPAGKVVLGDNGSTTYDANQSAKFGGEIAVLVDAGGSDTYRIPAGANQSASNGVSVTMDLGGDDTYAYETVSDPNDTQHLLSSDADGRKQPSSGLSGDGAVSLSTQARQGAGRLGIGALVDVGGGADTYKSLRMSQGAAVFGVGLLFDDGGQDEYRAEALAQGASLGGLAVAWDGGSANDTRKVWHAGQGFGTAAGTGVLVDAGGDDTYRATPGEGDPNNPGQRGLGVLYFSPPDRRSSNRNISQGAGVGIASTSSKTGLAGGRGILRDAAGDDTYRAGTHAQAYATVRGFGMLADAGGADSYRGRVLVQGVGQQFAGGLFDDAGGDDQYNKSTTPRRSGQGYGEELGWGVLRDAGGRDTIRYGNPGGGVGLDGGMGFVFSGGGKDTHRAQSGWGLARNNAMMGTPLAKAHSVGIFIEAGSDQDNYKGGLGGRSFIGNGKRWTQPSPPTPIKKGVGIDQ